ncbi:MAG TPA: hypothetical protein VI412_09075 [Tabrizicola sp.]
MHNRYIVVEPSLIVAQDLAYAINAFDPEAEVRLLSDPAQALAVLAEVRPAAVLLHHGAAGNQSIQVGRALLEAGVPVVLTGGEAVDVAEGMATLASPFSEATVALLLRQLLGHDSRGAD